MSEALHNIIALSKEAFVLDKTDKLALMQFLFDAILLEIDSTTTNNGQNELAFLLLSFNSLFTFTAELVNKIKNKINQLSDNAKTKNNNDKLPKPTDKVKTILTKLPEHLLPNIGQFLSRKQCIELGYTCQLLYDQTTTKSFKKNRQSDNEETLSLDQHAFDILKYNLRQSLLFEYPKSLTIDFIRPYGIERTQTLSNFHQLWFNNDKNIEDWNKIFENVKHLCVYNIDMTDKIPISTIFNSTKKNDKKVELIDIEFYLNGSLNSIGRDYESLKLFQQRYRDYLHNLTKNNKNIRQINQLRIGNIIGDDNCKEAQLLVKTLQYTWLDLGFNECHVHIRTKEDLNNLFNDKLKVLSIENQCWIYDDIESDTKSSINTVENCRLHTLYVKHFKYGEYSAYQDEFDIALVQLSKWKVWQYCLELNIDFSFEINGHNYDHRIPFIQNNGWLYSLLDSKQKHPSFPQLKFINIESVISETCRLETIVDEIYALSDIMDDINNNDNHIKTLTFILRLGKYTNTLLHRFSEIRCSNENLQTILIKNQSSNISTSDEITYQQFDQASVERVCIWLACIDREMKSGVEYETDIKTIVFSCEKK